MVGVTAVQLQPQGASSEGTQQPAEVYVLMRRRQAGATSAASGGRLDAAAASASKTPPSLQPLLRSTEYRNLCETVTRKVELNNDPTYDYQPPHYYEVFCKSYSLLDDEPQAKAAAAVVPSSRQKCAHPSFDCVQRSRTLLVMRRRWEDECWQPLTKLVASGCDCMWPVSTLGDVSVHYSTD